MDTGTQKNGAVTSGAIVAIVVIVLAALWVAFAYYNGSSAKGGAGTSIMLLHPVVALLLIVLLSAVRPFIEVRSVVNILIAMIGIWLFTNLLGVMMPFILGFAFAYFFRFLLHAMQDIPLPGGTRLQLSRRYAQAILTLITVGVFAVLFLYIIPQIGKQSQEMSKGLVRFYNQSIVPFAVGNDFRAVAVQPDNPNTLYIGTEHGIYRYQQTEKRMEDLTSGDLMGQTVQVVATTLGGQRLYAATTNGLYVQKYSTRQGKESRVWERVDTALFDGQFIQAVAIPSYNASQIYVGTNTGCYRLNRFEEWERVEVVPLPTPSSGHPSGEGDGNVPADDFSVRSIAFSSSATRVAYLASNLGIYTSRDNGKRWILMSGDMIEDLPIRALAVVSVAGEETLFAGTSAGFYRWQGASGAQQWVRANLEFEASMKPDVSVPILAALSSQQVFLAGNNKGLYRQSNASKQWEPILTAREGILHRLEKYPPLEDEDLDIVAPVKDYLTTKLPALAQTGSEFFGQLVRRFSSIAIGFGGFLATAFLTLMVFIYASQSFTNYMRSFIGLFPQSTRENVKLYLVEIDRNLQAFLRGQVVVILIISLISITVYSIIGVPFALVVGLLAGLCNAIPTFGPFIGGAFAILALLMGFAAGNFEGVGFLIRIAVLLGAIFGIQAIDNSLISPRVMSSAVDVDPLLIMFGVIVGASILGFWGVLLAIPIIVIIKSILTISKQVQAGRVESDGTEIAHR